MSTLKGIKAWAEPERPREKLLLRGAGALSDAELLAILIASGTPEKSALDLAREVLSLSDNKLHELGRLPIKLLQTRKGIGVAKAVTISAALELGRRRQLCEGLERVHIQKSKDIAEIVIPLLKDLVHESFCVLYLNHAAKLLLHEIISSGGMASTIVDVRLILKSALLNNAGRIAIAHNHPSGNLRPSNADCNLTRQVQEAARIMNIQLLDHLIVADNKYFSFSDEGLL